MGFELVFVDDGEEPRYAGVGRDGVELHLQWHSEQEWADGVDGNAYRFVVDDPGVLEREFRTRPQPPTITQPVRDTPWGTQEFGLYDPDGNALFFYRDIDGHTDGDLDPVSA